MRVPTNLPVWISSAHSTPFALRVLVMIGLFAGSVVATGAVGAYGQVADTPWPAFGHDHTHRRQSSYEGPKAPVGAAWFVDTGAPIRSGPVLGSDGTVYATSTSNYLYALGPDGAEKWRFQACSGLSSPPVVAQDGVLYVVKLPHWLYAVNTDGSERWRLEIPDETLIGPPVLGGDGTVYFLSKFAESGRWTGHLHAVRPDGEKKWTVDLRGKPSFPPTIGEEGTIYVGIRQSLTAVDPDGTKKWSKAFKGGSSLVIAGPDGDVYTGSLRIKEDGTVRRRYDVQAPILALGSDGTRYVGFDEGLGAVGPDGEKKWWFEVELDLDSALPTIGADGTVYVGAADGRVHAVSPEGTEKWRFDVGESVSSPVLGGNGTVYVAGTSGFLYAINTVDVEKGPPSIAVSPDSLSMFVRRPQNRPGPFEGRAEVTIRNEGWAPLEGRVASLEENSPFSVAEGAGSYRLQRGERRQIAVTYNSLRRGDARDTLAIFHDGAERKSPIQVPIRSEAAPDTFVIANREPALDGGMQALRDSVRYPEMAGADSLDGRVFVELVVDDKGRARDPKVVRFTGGLAAEHVPCAVTEAFRAEALNAIRKQTFQPGERAGTKVHVRITLPVLFDRPKTN